MIRTQRIYDPWLFGLSILATLVGMFFIFDAGYPQAMLIDHTSIPPEFRTQLIAAVVCVVAGIVASRVPPENWRRVTAGFGLVVLVLLIAVAKFGAERYGARRWIVGIQPAEFAKLATVLYLAAVFANRDVWPKRIQRRADFPQWLDTILVPKLARMVPIFFVLFAVILIDKEPDLGTAAVIAVVAFLMFFPGRVSSKSILAAVVIAGLGSYVMVHGESYRMGRILNHAHRWDRDNAVGATFQTDQAELAIATGGTFGVGVGNGQAKHVLPAATTDFIMATVGEETGLVGSLIVLAIIGAIVWRLYVHALRVTDPFGRLVLFGVASWIGVQSCVNVMMANAFLPAIGIPLPFISSGGSSLVALWLALGICQSAIAPAPEPPSQETALAPRRHRRRYRRSRLSRA